jgi:hypothetical protein
LKPSFVWPSFLWCVFPLLFLCGMGFFLSVCCLQERALGVVCLFFPVRSSELPMLLCGKFCHVVTHQSWCFCRRFRFVFCVCGCSWIACFAFALLFFIFYWISHKIVGDWFLGGSFPDNLVLPDPEFWQKTNRLVLIVGRNLSIITGGLYLVQGWIWFCFFLFFLFFTSGVLVLLFDLLDPAAVSSFSSCPPRSSVVLISGWVACEHCSSLCSFGSCVGRCDRSIEVWLLVE